MCPAPVLSVPVGSLADVALALYRKYRPAKFAEVVGQEHVTQPLSVAIEAGRINHAYLFSGPRGCGKTSSARILARSLNCELGPTPEPCGVCPSCVSLAPGGPGNIDVTELDAASHGGVDDTRELRDRAFFAPAESRYRVFIVDEAHMITTQGFNALLKIVEEPPEHLVFVFATTEPEKVLPTIRSRTHHYPFRLIPPGTLRKLLERICADEEVTVAPAVYPLVIRAGGGSARDSLSVLDQLVAGAGPEGVTYERAVALLGVTDVSLIDDVVDALAAGDRAAVFEAVDRLVEAGHDPRRFASDLLQRLRDLTLLQAVPEAVERGLVEAADDEMARMVEQSGKFGAATLTRYGEILHVGLTEMRGATAPRLLLELLCARMLLPAATTEEPGLLERLERLERRSAIAAGPPAPGEAGAGGTERPEPPGGAQRKEVASGRGLRLVGRPTAGGPLLRRPPLRLRRSVAHGGRWPAACVRCRARGRRRIRRACHPGCVHRPARRVCSGRDRRSACRVCSGATAAPLPGLLRPHPPPRPGLPRAHPPVPRRRLACRSQAPVPRLQAGASHPLGRCGWLPTADAAASAPLMQPPARRSAASSAAGSPPPTSGAPSAGGGQWPASATGSRSPCASATSPAGAQLLPCVPPAGAGRRLPPPPSRAALASPPPEERRIRRPQRLRTAGRPHQRPVVNRPQPPPRPPQAAHRPGGAAPGAQAEENAPSGDFGGRRRRRPAGLAGDPGGRQAAEEAHGGAAGQRHRAGGGERHAGAVHRHRAAGPAAVRAEQHRRHRRVPARRPRGAVAGAVRARRRLRAPCPGGAAGSARDGLPAVHPHAATTRPGARRVAARGRPGRQATGGGQASGKAWSRTSGGGAPSADAAGGRPPADRPQAAGGRWQSGAAEASGGRPAGRPAGRDDGVPLPPEPPEEDAPPDDEEAMLAELDAGPSEQQHAPGSDPEEAAIALLTSQLGARAIDRR